MAFGLFKKKKEKTEDGRYHQLVIQEVVPVAKDAVNLVFEAPDKGFDYRSGQFITLVDSVDGEKVRRAYSLCSVPGVDKNPIVTVKRVDGGRMSNHVNDNYAAGQTVEVMEPMGMFTIDFDASVSRKAVFIGGGSGITPLISLIRSMLKEEPKSEMTLIYGNRREEFIIFKDVLTDLEKNSEGRLKVIHILEEDEHGLAEIVGRPSVGMIQDLVTSKNLVDGEFYICGPQPMMDVCVDGLKAAEVNESQIRMESFEAGVTSPKSEESASSSSENSRVTIVLDGVEEEVLVPMGAPILETALDAGLDMPYSCQSGLCTACRGQCLEGDVTTDDAEGLSQQEIEEGYRLLCIGKPASDKIKIEIG